MTWTSNRKNGSRKGTKVPTNPAQTVMDFTRTSEVDEANATRALPTQVPEAGLCPREAAVLVMEKRSWTGVKTSVRVDLQGCTSVRHGRELLGALGGAMALMGTVPLTKGSHGMLLDLAHAAFWHHAYALFVLPALHGPGMALLAFVTG